MRTSTISPVFRRAARAVLAVAVAGLGAVAVAAPAPAQASTAGGLITRAEILDRAQYWVDRGLTYDTNAFSAGPDGGSYRRDCSGLVSMAWHLTGNYNTTAFQQLDGSHPWHGLGSLHELQPGDAIVRTGHMELFARWKSVADHSQGAYVYSFNTAGETVENPDAVSNFGKLGFDSYSDLTTYTPIRYDHVVGIPSYSGDGLADLQTVNTSTGAINHFRNVSPGNWAPVATVGSGWAGANPNRLHWADLTGDGRSDLVSVESGGLIKLYPNLGQGSWGTTVAIGSGWAAADPRAMYFADMDGDGRADLVFVNTSTGLISYYRNLSPGNWAPVATIGSGWAGADPDRLSFADMNGDGRADLLSVESGGLIKLYPNYGPGNWGTTVAIGSGWSAADPRALYFADMNGDGLADLVFVNTSTGLISYYRNLSPGNWAPVASIGSGWGGANPDTLYFG